MIVTCGPVPAEVIEVGDVHLAMMSPPDDDATQGRLGGAFRETVRRSGIVPSPLAWDFALLALAVVGADHACLRSNSPDGWTRQIELHVAFVEPDSWRPHVQKVEEALRFLTGDIWSICLHSGGLAALPRTGRVRRPRVSGDCVCLLSGGMDSLVGAIDLARHGACPILVSQVAKGDTDRQARFARAIDPMLDHVQLSHAATVPGPAERSQRARSMIFLAFGALAASSLGGVTRLVVPENGFISYNVPLTSLRVGSLSTRTTHPYFLGKIQELWDAVGMSVRLENPYQHKTKGEMLAGCADQDLLVRLAATSTSCGRFGRFGYQHCGRCVPCLVRRAAFLTWGHHDGTDYYFDRLAGQSGFDDVRSVAMACVEAQRLGVPRWSRGALSGEYVNDVDAAVDLVERGLAELRALLQQAGVL